MIHCILGQGLNFTLRYLQARNTRIIQFIHKAPIIGGFIIYETLFNIFILSGLLVITASS